MRLVLAILSTNWPHEKNWGSLSSTFDIYSYREIKAALTAFLINSMLFEEAKV